MPRDPVVDFVVIGAMKCGTTALHHHLDAHPDLGLASAKEVNFFFGDRPTDVGNFWRGLDWYDRCLPQGARLRGEASPGYTSPDHPEVARRLARVAPGAKLVYLVRDPLDRAVSQYRHHVRDGTEVRSLGEALVDPSSHYVMRSLHAQRLEPFLHEFPPAQVAVVDHGDLLHRGRATVAALCRFLGADPALVPEVVDRRLNRAGGPPPEVPAELAVEFDSLVADDRESFERIRAGVTEISPDPTDVPAGQRRHAAAAGPTPPRAAVVDDH